MHHYSPERLREYCNERYAAQREWMLDQCGGPVCIRCGSVEELELDHIDPSQKSFAVGGMWGLKKLHTVVKDELAKCQVLCKECHLIKSTAENIARDRPPMTHGTLYGWMKKHCGCDLCQSAKFAWHDERNARRRKNPAPNNTRRQIAQRANN
jgi:hypothetical protein